MPRFLVRFMKDVTGDNGHEVEICQASLEIDAPGKAQARQQAKRQFCENQRLQDWSLHADRISVLEADFPS
jgi:hypothetical protein